MKSYTDIEQSRKLAEILPIESADMHFHYDYDFDELESIPTITEEDNHFVLFPQDVECWSLAALLQLLPLEIPDRYDDNDYKLNIDMIDKMPIYRSYEMNHSLFPCGFGKDTLLDNIVESIIWLNDNNYLE